MAQPAAAPSIEFRIHGDFVDWLAAAHGTLAVTTYNSGKLALISASSGRLEVAICKMVRPMGLAYDHGRLAVAVREHILLFALPARGVSVGASTDAQPRPETDMSGLTNSLPNAAPATTEFALISAFHTGRTDAHELAFDSRGLCFANTKYNCISRPASNVRFRRVWQPAFVQGLTRRDCCHLNGIGIRDRQVRVVTAFCTGGEPGSWRGEQRFTSGVLVDVHTSRVLAGGLCMPHSPRWDGRQWWFCNSGLGALCCLDKDLKPFEAATMPGFTRGLAFAAGRAVVGLSRIRKRHILDAPPVRARFKRLRAGVWLVDPTSGAITGALEFIRGGREVFDVAFVPGADRAELCAWTPPVKTSTSER